MEDISDSFNLMQLLSFESPFLENYILIPETVGNIIYSVWILTQEHRVHGTHPNQLYVFIILQWDDKKKKGKEKWINAALSMSQYV